MIQMKVYKHPAIQMRQIRFGHWHRCVLVLPDALDPAEKDLYVLYSKATSVSGSGILFFDTDKSGR